VAGSPDGSRPSSQAHSQAPAGPPALSASQVRIAFAGLVLAMLPAVLDQTILATALPTIASDLGHLSDVSWVISAYVVTAAAFTPLWGKLADRHGVKRLLQIALPLFLVGSALSGATSDITQLVVFRAVQGIGAGGLMTLAMTAVGSLVAPRERGRYQGYIAATFAAATAIGPLVGGLLVQHVSWRWVFYVNLPLGALALLGLSVTLPAASAKRPRQPLDLSGAVLLAGATSTLLLSTIWGGERYAWSSPTILALITITLVLSAALTLRERHATDPIVPLRLLGAPVVAIASAALFLTTAALFAVTVFVPLFLQATTGASPTAAGLLMLPMMAGITISTTLSGRRIARTGRYKRFPITGLGLMTAALLLLAAITSQHSRVATGIGLAVFGLGFGLVTQVLVIAVQNSVERTVLGTATAATSFFRALGGAIGAAVLGAVFTARAQTHTPTVALHLLNHATRVRIADSIQIVLLLAAPLVAIALLVVLRLPELRLQTHPN
jgi:EmrB/QacA subfamily drug resistance transporter